MIPSCYFDIFFSWRAWRADHDGPTDLSIKTQNASKCLKALKPD